ncbi:MAG: aldehyde ferredoxin oxidoreductase family protein [Firmicutes bacterium]|nr:aldehyde ferredoxin oxidoreductase family protein [Bacillota bacterium]
MSSLTGIMLRVNLSENKVSKETIKREWVDNYFGGKGLGYRYLIEEVPAKVDPLSPKNKMVFITGPLAGTPVSSTSKLCIITKSPATGTILDCSIGGMAPAEIKFAGYDGIIIEGKAANPVYLVIDDSKVEIKDAKTLWGKGTRDTEFALRSELGSDDFKIMSIGQAGENLVPFSCITSEIYRQAGRGGAGAVMGSKNLKAMAIRGSGSLKMKDSKELMEKIKKVMKDVVLTADNLWAFTDGTPMIVDMAHNAGILPTRNFQSGSFEGYSKIDSESVKSALKNKKACFGCALGCGNFIAFDGIRVEGPEYETLSVAGSNCGIDDLKAVAEFNRVCDDYGIDTISAGGTIAYAMEMTERKIHDFGITFGDAKKYVKIPELIAKKEGVGKDLALGSKALSEKYGGREFAMHVKGLEIPGYEPRGSWGMSLAYGTAERGACHLRAWTVASEAFGDLDPFTVEGKAELVLNNQNNNAIKFSVCICDFWAISPEVMAEMTSLALEREVTAGELIKAGERIWNLGRLFNLREGFSRKDDYLPARIYQESLKGGSTDGKFIPLEDYEKMLSEYYSLRGWDNEGVPSKEKLEELGIAEFLVKAV